MSNRMERALQKRLGKKVIVQHTRGFVLGVLEENWPHFDVRGVEAFFRFSPVEVNSIIKDTVPVSAAFPNVVWREDWYIRLKV